MLIINDSLTVSWLGHGGVKIEFDGKQLFIDPYNVTEGSADFVLITHSHDRHLSLDDINKIKKDDTVFVVPYDAVDLFSGAVIGVKPHVHMNIYGIQIDTTPAYNLLAKPYHPKSKNWVGYIISLGGTRIYHCGDTDDIPEMKKTESGCGVSSYKWKVGYDHKKSSPDGQ